MSYQLVINRCGMSHRSRNTRSFLTISSAYLGQCPGMGLANDDNSYFWVGVVDNSPEGVNILEGYEATPPARRRKVML